MVGACFQRRLACSLFKCGRDKVFLDPVKMKEISAAKTRDDVRDLISQGIIKLHPFSKKNAPALQKDKLWKQLTARRRNEKKQKRENFEKRRQQDILEYQRIAVEKKAYLQSMEEAMQKRIVNFEPSNFPEKHPIQPLIEKFKTVALN